MNVLPYFTAEEESHAQMQRSRVASLSIAVLLHALLISLLAFVIVSEPKEKTDQIVVHTDPSPSEPELPSKPIFPTAQPKPQAPSMNTAPLVSAIAPAPLKIDLSPDLESPMIGLPGEGLDMGFGGRFGNGGGGGVIFDPVLPGSKRVVLAIDVSTSMRGVFGEAGIAAIKKEIARTINALPPDTAFNIVTFGNLADGYARKLVAADADHKKNAVAFMDWYYQSNDFRTRSSQFNNRGRDAEGVRYEPILPDEFRSLRGTTGGSRLDLALVAAFEQQADTVYLFTDGAPSTRKRGEPVSREELISIVEKKAASEYRKSRKPVVNCVGVNGVAEDYLREIAKAFGGEYKNITPDSLY